MAPNIFVALILATICLFGVVVIVHSRWTSSRWLAVLERLAQATDGRIVRGSRARAALAGTLDGYSFGVDLAEMGNAQRTRLRVKANVPDSLVLDAEARLGKRLSPADVEVGIEAFDDRFLLRGDGAAQVLALLGHRVREAMTGASCRSRCGSRPPRCSARATPAA